MSFLIYTLHWNKYFLSLRTREANEIKIVDQSSAPIRFKGIYERLYTFWFQRPMSRRRLEIDSMQS